MSVNSEHVTGFVVGLGAAALGFYLYKKNQADVDKWLRQQGINLPRSAANDPGAMPLEDLVREKERMEDLIAEREAATDQAPAAAAD